ncbi:MAG: hypothetical protein WBF48_12115 [Halarcobacter sp.]
MREQRYDIVDAAEDASKVGYSVGVFAAKAFYQVSGIEALKNSVDAYMLSRFSQRLEYFVHEHENLTYNEKKEFYDDLKSNKQNLNYLYEIIENTRTTTYELHAQILAKLSCKLIKNKEFNFYESSLLANLYTLTNEDFLTYKLVMNSLIKEEKKDINEMYGNTLILETNLHWHFISIQKFLNIGIISAPHSPPKTHVSDTASNDNYNFRRRMFIVVGEYSIDLLNILNELIDD